MQVILTGSTGFIGSEVLIQAVAHPAITSLICITRKPLPSFATDSLKVKTIILTDFSSYPPEILSQLAGAEACIWAVGAATYKTPDLEVSKRVEVDFPIAAAKAFSKYLGPQLKEKGKTLRFVHLSGTMANRDASKKMWFMHDQRTFKGSAENGLLALQQKEGSNMEVTIVRPGGVLAKGTLVPDILVGVSMSIKIEELAAFMVNEAVAAEPGTRTVENDVLRSKGKACMKARQ